MKPPDCETAREALARQRRFYLEDAQTPWLTEALRNEAALRTAKSTAGLRVLDKIEDQDTPKHPSK